MPERNKRRRHPFAAVTRLLLAVVLMTMAAAWGTTSVLAASPGAVGAGTIGADGAAAATGVTGAAAASQPTGVIVYGRCAQGGSDFSGTTYRIKPDASGDAPLVDGGYPRLRPDGKRIAVRRNGTTLATSALDGGSAHVWAAGAGVGFESNPAWSPDGTKLAIATHEGLAESHVRTYTDAAAGTFTSVAHASDVSGLLFLDWVSGHWLMEYTHYVDGGDPPVRRIGESSPGSAGISDLAAATGAPGWLGLGTVRYRPDGTPSWIGGKTGETGLYVNGTFKITVPSATEYAFSPDGKYLAVVRRYDTGPNYLDLLSYDSTPHFIRTLTTGAFLCGVDWGPDVTAGKQVSGTVYSLVCGDSCSRTGLAGVTIKATGPKAATTTTAADGTWSLRLGKGAYTLTPTLADRVFDPETRSVTVATDDVDGVDFNSCGLVPPPSIRVAATTTDPRQGIASPTACSLKLDWHVPDRYPAKPTSDYLETDRLLTRAYTNPETWKVTLYIRAGAEERKSCDGYRFSWKITPKSGGATVSKMGPAGSCHLDTTVPREGTYTVTSQELKKQKNGTYQLTGRNGAQAVVVQDWLIVAMGDSLASGEGNPDVPAADGFGPTWQSVRCHRSFKSWQARVAERIEDADRHSSVTLLHAGCSGASIEHLIDRPYVGMEQKAKPKLRPQLGQLESRLAGADREVDAILLSIGVNDLDFGSVIVMCAHISAASCQITTVTEVRDADDKQTLEHLPTSTQLLRDFEVQRVGELLGRYDALDDELVGVEPARVFIPAYAELTKDEHGHTCSDTSPGEPVDWRGITVTEAKWISSTGAALNHAIGLTADSTGWTYVPATAAAFNKHGWCSTHPWIQSPKGSLRQQGNIDGAMHPINDGPQAIADLVVRKVCMQFYDNDTGSCKFDPLISKDGIRRPGPDDRLFP